MRILSALDMEKSISPKEAMAAVKEALLIAEGDNYSMPKRLHADFRGNTLLVMPCFFGDAIGTKVVSVFPDNLKLELPVINGVMILGNPTTGKPEAILDGATLTAVRTGALGGVGAEMLNTKDSPKMGVIGCGVQGLGQAINIVEAVGAKEVSLFDLDKDSAKKTRSRLQNLYPDTDVAIKDTVAKLVENSDIVVTATTSQKPVIPDNDQLVRGKTFVAIGSFKPDMRELPDAIAKLATRIFVDTEHAREESGDVAIPLQRGLVKPEEVHTLGKLLNGSEDKPSAEETKLFKSVGMALFDVMVANLIYKRASQDGIGVQVNL